MKILYAATDQDLAYIHGGTVHINAVVQELIRHGNEVHLLVQRSEQPKLISSGARIHELPRMNRFLLWTA